MATSSAESFVQTNTLYEDLEASPTMSQDELRAQYKRLALQYHPDKADGLRAQFDRVQHAWEMLGDETSRAAYDRALQHERTTTLRASCSLHVDDCDIVTQGGKHMVVAACRCGGQFMVDLEGVGEAGIIVPCSSCSLKARIHDGEEEADAGE